MNRTRLLEKQRSAILLKIHMSREECRNLLLRDTGADMLQRPRLTSKHEVIDVPSSDIRGTVVPRDDMTSRALADPAKQFNHSGQVALTWVKEHPVLSVTIVAIVAAIGPRRLARTSVRGARALAALTLGSSGKVDAVNQILSAAARYVDSRR